MTARFPNPRSAFRRGRAMHFLLGETVAARSAGMRAALNIAFRDPQLKCLTISILEPVWKLRGALRRGILAVAKAALAARSAPQRAVRNEPTPATGKRPAARRVFGEKAIWLRPARECFRSCSVVAARSASLVAPAIRPFARKQRPSQFPNRLLVIRSCAPDGLLTQPGRSPIRIPAWPRAAFRKTFCLQ